jgi:hypothetical protein
MTWMRVSGAVQLSLLLAIIAVADDPRATVIIASVFCCVLVITWMVLSSFRTIYAGWTTSFLFYLVYFKLPIAALVYVLLGPRWVPLLLACAFAVYAELFRERCVGEHQFGWAVVPLASTSIALWFQLGDVRSVVFETIVLTAVVCTSISTMRIEKKETGTVTEQPRLHDQTPHDNRARSLNQAA